MSGLHDLVKEALIQYKGVNIYLDSISENWYCDIKGARLHNSSIKKLCNEIDKKMLVSRKLNLPAIKMRGRDRYISFSNCTIENIDKDNDVHISYFNFDNSSDVLSKECVRCDAFEFGYIKNTEDNLELIENIQSAVQEMKRLYDIVKEYAGKIEYYTYKDLLK